jgi:hypothetical protein
MMDFYDLHTFVLGNWFPGLGNSSRRFEGMYNLHIEGCESVNSLISLKMEAVYFFET